MVGERTIGLEPTIFRIESECSATIELRALNVLYSGKMPQVEKETKERDRVGGSKVPPPQLYPLNVEGIGRKNGNPP